MIKIQANNANILNIETELMLKVGGVKELTSQVVLTELANAVFTLSSKAFIKAMNMEAKANPKKYHHIYEWNQTGLSQGRLFFLYRQNNLGGKLVINPGFAKSKNKVPIDPALLSPGKTGKTVASRHVFKDKASVMEYGKPIIYRASKNIPMVDNGEVRFIAAGTLIKNYSPGGKEVKGSFEKFYNLWFDTKVNSVISASGMMERIDDQVAAVLNVKGAGPSQVRTAIINLLRQYSKGETII